MSKTTALSVGTAIFVFGLFIAFLIKNPIPSYISLGLGIIIGVIIVLKS